MLEDAAAGVMSTGFAVAIMVEERGEVVVMVMVVREEEWNGQEIECTEQREWSAGPLKGRGCIKQFSRINNSLVVYRLVHAPVTCVFSDARKLGSTPSQGEI